MKGKLSLPTVRALIINNVRAQQRPYIEHRPYILYLANNVQYCVKNMNTKSRKLL